MEMDASGRLAGHVHPEDYVDLPRLVHGRTPTQMSVDTVAGGRYHETDVDEMDDHPWKLKNREAMAFTMDEVLSYDAHLCNVQESAGLSFRASSSAVCDLIADGHRNQCRRGVRLPEALYVCGLT